MFQKVIDYLNKKGWSYNLAKDSEDIFITLSNDNGTYHCIIYVKKETKILAFVSFLGSRCPIEKVGHLLALVNKVNDTLLYSNFEISSLGEIKCRTSLYVENFDLTDEIIEGLILRNIYNIDEVNPVFLKIMFGDMTVEEAYNLLFPHRKEETSELEQNKATPLLENPKIDE